MKYLEASERAEIFVGHAFEEKVANLGEVRLNYTVVGGPELPALLLIPGQAESWWGYERALPLLAPHFQAYAVDLRGQGRSTWTPGRYSLDNFGNDLVRFIDLVIGRPTIVSGLSAGGVLSAWLAAFAKPGQVRAAVWEDPPLFASEVDPAFGQSINQAIGPMFTLWNKWLGDQWSIGDWAGMQKALPQELPVSMLRGFAAMSGGERPGPDAPQNLKEYDPGWAKAFVSGSAAASCSHRTMLEQVKVPVLFTHHFHQVDEEDGTLIGAISDLQAQRVQQLVRAAGQQITYLSFPQMPHSMHGHDPQQFVTTVLGWASTLNDRSDSL